MNIFTQFFKRKPRNDNERRQEILRDLMRRESELNKDLFGPVPKGTRREFFNLDKNTWVWHEEWTDENGKDHAMNTRYVVRDNEVLKSQNDGPYKRLSLDEAKNFKAATAKYVKKINSELYVSHQHDTKV